jgi:hypothetical protein
MHATPHRHAGTSAAFLLAALFAVSLFTWDRDAMTDDPTDDLISPWCRIGSLESWEGRPCAFPLRTGSVEGTASPRSGQQNGRW